MLMNRLFYLGLLPAVISGCSQSLHLLTGKEPAPVYENQPVVYQAPEPVVNKAVPLEPTQDIEIKPIDDSSTVAIEPLPTEPAQQLLTPEQEKELAALEKSAAQDPNNTALPFVAAPATGTPTATGGASPEGAAPTGTGVQNPPAPGTTPPTTSAQPAATLPSVTSITLPQPEVAVVPPPPPPPPPPFEALENFGSLSPVVSTLVLAANKSADKNVDLATTTIERAIRIEPRNPVLFYKLACYHLKQKKPDFALVENLAKKSALLAGSDKELKKSSWLLIAHARDKQNNSAGAKEARKKAEKF